MLKIKKITLLPFIAGVAPGAAHDPSVELLYDDEDDPTVHIAAIRHMTDKLPVVVFERDEVRV